MVCSFKPRAQENLKHAVSKQPNAAGIPGALFVPQPGLGAPDHPNRGRWLRCVLEGESEDEKVLKDLAVLNFS